MSWSKSAQSLYLGILNMHMCASMNVWAFTCLKPHAVYKASTKASWVSHAIRRMFLCNRWVAHVSYFTNNPPRESYIWYLGCSNMLRRLLWLCMRTLGDRGSEAGLLGVCWGRLPKRGPPLLTPVILSLLPILLAASSSCGLSEHMPMAVVRIWSSTLHFPCALLQCFLYGSGLEEEVEWMAVLSLIKKWWVTSSMGVHNASTLWPKWIDPFVESKAAAAMINPNLVSSLHP